MNATVQTKSQLAKLLATENISFRHNPSAKTACFDIKNRMLTLPVWRNISNDLYDMLVVHEVGHALDTPVDGWLNGITDIVRRVYGKDNPAAERAVKDFMNVIEDARIDKRQKRRYPGSRRNYIVGYKELIERDFFGTAKLDINTLNFIDRANIYFKGGFNLGIRFNDEERDFIKRMENAETFKEVLELTEEIFRRAKELGQTEQRTVEQEIFAEFGDEDEDDNEYEYGDSDDDEFEDDGEVRSGDMNRQSKEKKSKDQEDGDDASDNAQSERGERGEGDIDENSDTGADKPSNGAGSSNTTDDDYIPESLTERTWQEKQDNIVVNENVDYIYLNIPKVITKNIVDDYKVVIDQMYKSIINRYSLEWFNTNVKSFNDFKRQENNTISFMVKEFEMRKQADTYARISIAKTGVIDTNKLHSYKYNDDIFRRLAILPNGKNHGFIMFLDWSGSMHYNIRETMKQLISLTLFCKRVQVPFEVYAFRDLMSDATEYKGEQFEEKEYSIKFETFKFRNVLSSRMNLTELNKAFNCLWCANGRINSDPMGGTPLNQAIIAAEQLVNDFRKRNKLQIVNTVFLTDGDSNNINGYVGRIDREYSYTRKKKQYFIQDEVTKNEYELGDTLSDNLRITKTFLNILKDRTQSNLIGIFLSNDGIQYNVSKYFSHVSSREPIVKFWKENKFLPVTTAGYDEYYIINARELKMGDAEMTINSGMTKSSIAKEFLKFSEKKTVNRVLLGRLIDHVTSNAKVKPLKMA